MGGLRWADEDGVESADVYDGLGLIEGNIEDHEWEKAREKMHSVRGFRFFSGLQKAQNPSPAPSCSVL